MEREIEWEEINKIMSNLRLNKAMGLDDIPNEVWRYGGEDTRKWVWETCNKIYTSILAERLREEVEEKGIIPENQTGFRKGRGVMDNIYVLNYLAQRQISREKKKLISVFIDLKTAFDSVDREVLVRALRERGVREGLIERIEEVIGETKSRVRIGEEISEEF
ncbi:uncharacterized protein LOC115242799 [Formica exsecta]|uniref:uncharacterized protein LOC115242799 n=1 Tax=Formica exsecta TaxID=72781 RepID=UPI0011434C87|nr:uncharacterized protein LOC115242799 [Formica exsecta]